jgi:hypothetical protein
LNLMPIGGGGIGRCSRGTIASAVTVGEAAGEHAPEDVDDAVAAVVAVPSQVSGSSWARKT